MLLKPATHDDAQEPGLLDLLMACHDRIRSFSSLAIEAATRDEAPEELIVDACARVKRYFQQALPHHVADEEQSILPRLRGQSDAVDRALGQMARQHREHEALLDGLLHTLEAVQRTPRREDARRALLKAARALKGALEEHLAFEESLLFPAIAERLSPEAQGAIIIELRDRRRPAQTRIDPQNPRR